MASEALKPVCCVEGCDKPASMVCPTCKKKGLPDSYFCDQVCFKKNWPGHKKVHKKAADAAKQAASVLAAAMAGGGGGGGGGGGEGKGADGAAGDGGPFGRAFEGFSFTGALRPGVVSARRTDIPAGIAKPDYADTSVPLGEQEVRRAGRPSVDIKSADELDRLRKACRIGREVIDIAGNAVRVGVTGEEIDQVVHQACIERNAYPSPLNYMGFPKSLCTSVNEVICHGIPDDRPLEDGDIVNLDITVYVFGMHADLNETFLVGNCSEATINLVKTAHDSLRAAVAEVRPGTMYRDLGPVITRVAKAAKCQVVKTYVHSHS